MYRAIFAMTKNAAILYKSQRGIVLTMDAHGLLFFFRSRSWSSRLALCAGYLSRFIPFGLTLAWIESKNNLCADLASRNWKTLLEGCQKEYFTLSKERSMELPSLPKDGMLIRQHLEILLSSDPKPEVSDLGNRARGARTNKIMKVRDILDMEKVPEKSLFSWKAISKGWEDKIPNC